MAPGVGNSNGKIRAEQTSVTQKRGIYTGKEVGAWGKPNKRKAARAGVRGEDLPWSQETQGHC